MKSSLLLCNISIEVFQQYTVEHEAFSEDNTILNEILIYNICHAICFKIRHNYSSHNM
jgi:hypothetical protein